MKGRRKKIQHVFVYFVMLGMSAFLIMGGMRQLAMTHELRTSINQKQKEKKALSSKKKELEKAKQNWGSKYLNFQVKTTRPLWSSFFCAK